MTIRPQIIVDLGTHSALQFTHLRRMKDGRLRPEFGRILDELAVPYGPSDGLFPAQNRFRPWVRGFPRTPGPLSAFGQVGVQLSRRALEFAANLAGCDRCGLGRFVRVSQELLVDNDPGLCRRFSFRLVVLCHVSSYCRSRAKRPAYQISGTYAIHNG